MPSASMTYHERVKSLGLVEWVGTVISLLFS